jgi:hypothetical protein
MGLRPDNFIVWAHNGIEYVYPPQVMTRVFSCSEIQLSELTVREEAVFLNGSNAVREISAERSYAALTQVPSFRPSWKRSF